MGHRTKHKKLGVENTGGLHDWGKGKAPQTRYRQQKVFKNFNIKNIFQKYY